MNSEKGKTTLKILAALPANELIIVVAKLITGDIYGTGSSVTIFTCAETSAKWKMAAIGFPTLHSQQEDTRSFGLEHIEGSKEIKDGYTLISG